MGVGGRGVQVGVSVGAGVDVGLTGVKVDVIPGVDVTGMAVGLRVTVSTTGGWVAAGVCKRSSIT